MVIEKKKKRMIRINCAEDVISGTEPWNYSTSTPRLYYGFCGKEVTVRKNDRYKQQNTNIHMCREILTGRVYDQETKRVEYEVPIDMDTFRLLLVGASAEILSAEVMKERLFSAKRIMNLIEEYNGWEKSTIATVKHVCLKKNNHSSFLFTGPKEYVRYPQIMSMVSLIFRIAFNGLTLHDESLDEFFDGIIHCKKNIDSVNKKITDIIQLKEDVEYLYEIIPYLKTLFDKFNVIFKGNYKKYYPENRDEFIGYGGITSFIRCKTGDLSLNKKVQHYLLKTH